MRNSDSYSGMDESLIIRSAAEGSLDAFNKLVLAYQDLLYQQAYRIMGDQESAEDIVQDSFIRAYHAIRNYRGGSFRAWLLRIVTNSCYDELRKRKRTAAQPLFPLDDDGEEIESADWLVDKGAYVEELYDQAELSETIQRSLNLLPPMYRAVVTLVDVLEIDYTEAAQILKVPLGTVKSRLARARLRLKDLLSKPSHEGFALFSETTRVNVI